MFHVKQLPPKLYLAPMEDVSDPPFRQICKTLGADVVITEFVSSEALFRNIEKAIKKTLVFRGERPVGVQIFGNDKKSMLGALKICEKTKPDFIDINFGCPVKKIVSKGMGAGILKNISLMAELTKEIVDNTSLPVTVKTRLGWDEKTTQIAEVVKNIENAGAVRLTIHARTRCQLYKGVANWSWFDEIKKARKKMEIVGNGDISTPEVAYKKHVLYGLDGLMIGRAAIGNPWIFNQIKEYFKFGRATEPSFLEKIEVCKEHLIKSIEWKGETKAIQEMKKHYSKYFKGFQNFKANKIKLMASKKYKEVLDVLEKIKYEYK